MGSHTDEARVLDMTSLKALAHPLRVQILDALTTYGPATASGLAERLGESSGATSYHLRQLEKHGFVRELTDRGRGRERWWERVPGPIAINPLNYSPESAERAASQLVLAEWQRTKQRLLQDFLSRGEEVLSRRWLEVSQVNSANVPLTADQLEELGRRVGTVIREYVDRYRGQRAPGVRPVHIQFNAFPPVDGDEVPDAPEGAFPSSRSEP